MAVEIRDDIYSGIAEQFPNVYKESGDFLIEFVKAYYKHTDEVMDRNVPKLRDIDTTLSTFLIYYKKKYLADLPIDTSLDTRFIIKHIQDMYKRKGTQEGLELLFKLFFNEEIEVFYPKTSILRPSDSIWGGDTYIEMKNVYTVDGYPISKGNRIKGDLSNATAFVDEVIFVNFSGALVPIIYLSNVSGNFSADDGILVITTDNSGTDTTRNVGKLIEGSISSILLNVNNRVAGQTVGDQVELISSSGSGAKAIARVTETSQTETGIMGFEILDGGFGYADPNSITASNDIGISNQVMLVSGTTALDIKPGDLMMAAGDAISYDGSTAGGATAYAPTGSARVIAYKHPLLFIESSDYGDVSLFLNKTANNGSNLLSALITHISTGATMINDPLSASYLKIGNSESIFNTGGLNRITGALYHQDGNTAPGTNSLEVFTDFISAFDAGLSTAATATQKATGVFPVIAVSDLNGYDNHIKYVLALLAEFNIYPKFTMATEYDGANPAVRHLTHSATGIAQGGTPLASFPSVSNPIIPIFRFRRGTSPLTVNMSNFGTFNNSASVDIGTLTNEETVSLITDQIGDFLTEVIDPNNNSQGDNGEDYGMSGPGQENYDTSIADAFSAITVKIGSIDTLNLISSGSNFTNDVETLLKHDNIAKFKKHDVIVSFESVDFNIEIGDIVTQDRTIDEVDINQAGNITETGLESLTDDNSALPGYANSSTTFEFTSGGTVPYVAKARLVKREGNRFFFRPLSFHGFDPSLPINISGSAKAFSEQVADTTSPVMGENAVVVGTASFQTGQIDSLGLIKSGYQYLDNDTVDVINIDASSPYYNQRVATATIRTLGQGKTEGRWRSKTSFLSESSKKLHDNNYYQDYSYDISSIIEPSRYQNLISETVGVAGTKLFSTPLINSSNDIASSLDVEFTYYDLTSHNYVTTDGTQTYNDQNLMTADSTSLPLMADMSTIQGSGGS